MSASSDLHAFATYYERAASAVPLNDDDADRWKMSREDWQRHLEAKARLHERAGNAAKVLEDRP